MLSVPIIESFYTYFYQRKYGNRKFQLKQTKATLSVCESFLNILDKEYSLHGLGQTFLWDYFIFQFQYWEDLALQNTFTDKIPVSWIVGKKAFARWKERATEYDWQISIYPIVNKYELLFSELVRPEPLQVKNTSFDLSKSIRKKYLNTEIGQAMCIQFTTLFDPKDISCITCKNRTDCKELLRVNYPKIYQKRIV